MTKSLTTLHFWCPLRQIFIQYLVGKSVVLLLLNQKLIWKVPILFHTEQTMHLFSVGSLVTKDIEFFQIFKYIKVITAISIHQTKICQKRKINTQNKPLLPTKSLCTSKWSTYRFVNLMCVKNPDPKKHMVHCRNSFELPLNLTKMRRTSKKEKIRINIPYGPLSLG